MDGQALNRPLWVYVALGLAQGVLLWLAGEHWPTDPLWRAICSGVLMAVLVGGWQLQMTFGALRDQRRWLWIALSALLIGALTAGLAWQFDGWRWYRYRDHGGQWLFAANVAIAFVLTAFIQARGGATRGRFDYPALCRNAWNNGLALLLASLMLGGFWLLIALWVGLFKVMGIRFFADIFYTSGFGWGASALVCSIALRISLERGSILDALRNVIQAMCRFLLPLTVLILLLFVATLPVLGLEPLWNTRHASAILLSLVFAHLCLVNGVFQDGSEPSGYPRWLQLLVNLSSLLLPLLAGLASYALWLRVAQYGLTPERVFACVAVLLANLYALALCWAVLRRQGVWLGALRASNPWLALASVALLAVIQVGPLSPLQLSASSQYQRLLEGVSSDERADLGYLRFDLGAPGRAQLQQLRNALPDLEPARRERLEGLMQALDAAENYWSWRQGPVSAVDVRWQGEPLQSATGLQEQARKNPSCRRNACALWAQDLNADGRAEVLLIGAASYNYPVYAQDDAGEWQQIGRLSAALRGEEVLERLTAGEPIRLVPPAIQALQIGDLRLEPSANR